jgi:hypothetical protein
MRLAAAVIVGLVAFSAGWLAMLPGLGFWDTAELQTVGPLMGTAHPTGYPTYVLIGWGASVILQAFGEPAFRMNLLSAICLAVAAGVTVDLVRRLTGWLVLGVAAGIAMALTPIAWAIGTHAEAHSLHLAFVAILMWLLVAWEADGQEARDDRLLVAAAVVFGLAVGNHSLTLLLAVPVALYVLAVEPRILQRRRLVIRCVGSFAVTLAIVYLELALRAGPFRAALVYGAPNTLEGFVYVVFGTQFAGSVVSPIADLPLTFGELAGRAVAQFGVVAPAIPIAFVVTAIRRPRYALLTGTAAAFTVVFAASYENADILRYYLGPALMAWTWVAILAGTVVDAIAGVAGYPTGSRSERRLSHLIAIVVALALLAPTALAIPARYGAVDESQKRAATIWADRALQIMEPDALVVSWWGYSTPLWYRQRVLGERPDIAIVDDRTRLDENLGSVTDVIDANLGDRPVYVIRQKSYEAASLAMRYELDYLGGTDARSLTLVVGPKVGS